MLRKNSKIQDLLPKNLPTKTHSWNYLTSAIVAIFLMILAVMVFVCISFKGILNENSVSLKKSAKSISATISEFFDYSNQININIGQKIADHGAQDLKFILKTFHEADQIKNRNSGLISWSSFDWVDTKNHQVVNSKLGIRKNSPDMSDRQYPSSSRQNPWILKVSFPVIGDPSKTWVIPAGMGVTDKNGRYIGSIVVGFDIAEMSARIEQRLANQTSFVVLDQNLRIILQSIDVNLARDSNFFQTKFDPEIFPKDSVELEEAIKIGDINLNHYEKNTKYPYIILTGFSESFLNHQFNIFILPNVIELICLTIFFLAILYLFEVEKKLRISLKKANEDKDKIFSSIAHDIKNQIVGIGGLADMALENKTKSEINSDESLRKIKIISEQSKDLMDFIRNLLDTNQIKKGIFRLGEVKENSINSIINEVITVVSSVAKSNDVTLKINLENNLPKLRCDRYKMKEILINLITNAIKYSRTQSEVLIAAKHLKNTKQIYIEIIDNGYGMSEEEVARYLSGAGKEIDKSEIAKEKKIDSYGIGMPIVLKLLELHKAKIKVESKKNSGTKISLFFDIINSEDNHAGTSLLLVEDNPVNAKVTKHILTNSGYEVSHVENGKKALEILDKKDFKLILMDCEMPIMNGYEATRNIRDGSFFKNFKKGKIIPIIALTSCNSDNTYEKAINSGMNDLVEKSISKANLLETIKHYLNT